MDTDISQRLRQFAKRKGFKDKELARAAQVSKQTISAYLSGENQPSAKALINLAQKYGLDLNWLLTGEPAVHEYVPNIKNIGPMGESQPAPQICPNCSTDFAGHIVDVYSTIGAGPAREHWEPEPLFQVCIPERFYWQNLIVIRVEGSSMEPMIRKGAFVGLDTAQTWIVAGEIYAVRIPYEGLTLKRVFVDPEHDRLRLQSENPTHPEQFLPIDGREDLVVGKAVWVMQEI